MIKPQNSVQLGIVGAAHGIRGEVRVKSFTQDPLGLKNYGPLSTSNGETLTIQSIRPSKTVVIVKFKEITDRNQAEALNGRELYIDKSKLPQNLDEEEFYYTDLIGLKVQDELKQTVGKVIAVHNFGAGDILEIRQESGSSVMIPFTQAAVPAIHISDGWIAIDSEAAGLQETEEDLEDRAERDTE